MTSAMLALAAPAWAQTPATLTIDASGEPVYVALGTEARVVAVEEPSASAEWDISFAGTSVMVNGGEAGQAGVTAYCVCANADASNAEVQAMTPETELADFASVTAAHIPTAEDAWHPASLAAAPWYRYNIAGQHLIWPTYDVYLVRRGEDVYKLQIIGYYGEDGTPRQPTFRYEKLQPS